MIVPGAGDANRIKKMIADQVRRVNNCLKTFNKDTIYIHHQRFRAKRKSENGWCIPFLGVYANCPKYCSLYIHHQAMCAPAVVYIESVICFGNLHIHQEMVYTNHLFLSPNPVMVYIYIYMVPQFKTQ